MERTAEILSGIDPETRDWEKSTFKKSALKKQNQNQTVTMNAPSL